MLSYVLGCLDTMVPELLGVSVIVAPRPGVRGGRRARVPGDGAVARHRLGAGFFVTILGVTFRADGLRDATDPRLRA